MSALGGLAACAPASPPRIALHPWAGYQFLSLAKDEGWLRSDDVSLVETAILPDSARALARGEVDGAGLTLDELLRLRDQGIPLSALLVFSISAGADALLVRPHIRTLAQLQGQRIGVEASSLGAIMLDATLKAAGLKRDEVTVVPMNEDHVQAWQRNDMDALLTYEPALNMLESRGLERLFDSRRLPQTILDVLAVRTPVARQHARALRTLIEAHFRAVDLWRRNPVDTAHRLSARLGIHPDGVRRVFSGLDLPDAAHNRHYLTEPHAELGRAATEVALVMQREGMLNRPLDMTGLFVPDYLPRTR